MTFAMLFLYTVLGLLSFVCGAVAGLAILYILVRFGTKYPVAGGIMMFLLMALIITTVLWLAT